MMLFLPPLDILTCNSANKQSFDNPTKRQKLQFFPIFASYMYLASIVNDNYWLWMHLNPSGGLNFWQYVTEHPVISCISEELLPLHVIISKWFPGCYHIYSPNLTRDWPNVCCDIIVPSVQIHLLKTSSNCTWNDFLYTTCHDQFSWLLPYRNSDFEISCVK